MTYPAPYCTSCNAPLTGGAPFCGSCGAPVAAAFPPTSTSRRTPGTTWYSDPGFWREAARRAQQQFFLVIVLGFVAYLDYRLHRSIVFAAVLFVLALAAGLFMNEIVGWVRRQVDLSTMPPWAESLFITIPGSLFFLIRGKGTLSSGNAFLVIACMIGLPMAFAYFAPRVDPSLRGYYRTRDRWLPSIIRPVVMITISLVVTFGLIHGEIRDVKVLIGKTAINRAPPSSSDTFLTAFANVAIGFMLLHRPEQGDVRGPQR